MDLAVGEKIRGKKISQPTSKAQGTQKGDCLGGLMAETS